VITQLLQFGMDSLALGLELLLLKSVFPRLYLLLYLLLILSVPFQLLFHFVPRRWRYSLADALAVSFLLAFDKCVEVFAFLLLHHVKYLVRLVLHVVFRRVRYLDVAL